MTDRLLLDAMCGSLARLLRFCGLDAAYALDRGVEADDDLLELARTEDRLLVTRDADLAARAGKDALLLPSTDVDDQLRTLREADVDVSLPRAPSRCGACNGPLDPVPPNAETPADAPDPAATDCWRCRACGAVFWKGSHWDAVRERLRVL